MIQMTRGAYGLKDKGVTVAKTKRSAPFSLSDKEEKRLVNAGVAVYVEDTKKPAPKAGGTKSDTAEVPGSEG